jgi:SAM-dependent methyltransferase
MVVAADLSHDALRECQRAASERPELAPVCCVVADLRHLPFRVDSFDAVLARSVLIYIHDKTEAIGELQRVLRPSGRVSVFEPINELAEQERQHRAASGFFDDLEPEYRRVQHYIDHHGDAWYGTLVGWDERDLVRWFEEVGFQGLSLAFERTSTPFGRPTTRSKAAVATTLLARPNPNMPSYEEIARQVLGDDADGYLERYAAFLYQRGGLPGVWAVAYVVARK